MIAYAVSSLFPWIWTVSKGALSFVVSVWRSPLSAAIERVRIYSGVNNIDNTTRIVTLLASTPPPPFRICTVDFLPGKASLGLPFGSEAARVGTIFYFSVLEIVACAVGKCITARGLSASGDFFVVMMKALEDRPRDCILLRAPLTAMRALFGMHIRGGR